MTSPPFTAPPAPTTRPDLAGTFGMAASTHWIATATAQSVLERGGNAFDAAAAAGFVLHVVEPHLNGPGGDLTGVFATAAEPDRPDADAHQTECGQPRGGGHSAHLTVAALGENQLDPGRWDQAAEPDGGIARWQRRLGVQHPDTRRTRLAALNHHALSELGQGCFRRRPLHLSPIRARVLEPRIGKPVLQRSIAGEQQQPLTVRIQAPGGKD